MNTKEYKNREDKPLINKGFIIESEVGKVNSSFNKLFDELIKEYNKMYSKQLNDIYEHLFVNMTKSPRFDDKVPRCECGGHKTNNPHSRWCPVWRG